MSKTAAKLIDYESLFREQMTINDSLVGQVASLKAQVASLEARMERAAELIAQASTPMDTAFLIMAGNTEEVMNEPN